MKPRAEWRLVDAAARTVNHDPDVPGVHVDDRRRQQHEHHDESNDQPEHATNLAAQVAATVQAAEIYRRQMIADRATH